MSLSPAEEFLASDPRDAFLASGGPEAFLRDNLPGTESIEDDEDEDRREFVLALAVGIAGAFIAWRLYARSQLRQMPPPTPRDEGLLGRLAGLAERQWMAVAVPGIADAYSRFLGLPPAQAEGAAAAYAAGLGQYVHQSSAEALIAGYTAELSRGVNPEIAWARATMGYGLSNRQMRSWIIAQRNLKGPEWSEPLSVAAKRQLDKAILQRADALGQTEAWQARQIGRSILWMTFNPQDSKRWITARDELVCPVCGPLDGQTIPVKERFELPDGRRLWAPGVHPNCRCELERVPAADWNVEKLLRTNPVEQVKDPETVLTPTGRKKLVVLATANELEARRRKKLKAKAPGHPVFTQPVVKAVAGDPYDRDSSGRFAREESRDDDDETQTGGGLALLERPTEEVTTAPQDTVVDVFEDYDTTAEVDAFAGVAAATEVDAFTDVDAFADVDVFTVDAFPDVDTTTDTAVGTGGGHNIFFVGAKAERRPDDGWVMASMDWFKAPFSVPAKRPDLDTDDYESLMRSYGRVTNPAAPDKREQRPSLWGDQMPDDPTPRDVNTIVDFDAWARANEREMAGGAFEAMDLTPRPGDDGNRGLFNLIREAAGGETDEWSEDDSDFHQQRYDTMMADYRHMPDEVQSLSGRDARLIFFDAGRNEEGALRDAGELKNYLAEIAMQEPDDLSAEDHALIDAYLLRKLESNVGYQDALAERESDLYENEAYEITPTFLTFKGATGQEIAQGRQVMIRGKWRITAVRTHDLTRQMSDPRAARDTLPAGPRVFKWKEVVLEKVE